MISLIVAMDKNRAIGRANSLPWYLSADLAKFKQLTTGHPIIMGRKTFESIGRVLPNRTNIVITRNPEWSYPGCQRATNLVEAIDLARLSAGNDEVFVIGGGEIFSEAIELADRLYITEIDTTVDSADVFFPEVNLTVWQEVSRETHERDVKNEYDYSFVVYERSEVGPPTRR